VYIEMDLCVHCHKGAEEEGGGGGRSVFVLVEVPFDVMHSQAGIIQPGRALRILNTFIALPAACQPN